MNIPSACTQILSQLDVVLREISDTDYKKPSPALSHSTIGQHLRHTLEFFVCLEQGYASGVVNYDNRAHDKAMETDKAIAGAYIDRITTFVNGVHSDKILKLEVGYDLHANTFTTISTNVTRELVYNIEHAVHHMALMKIGIREIAPYIKLPPDFGVAASTVRWKEEAASPTFY